MNGSFALATPLPLTPSLALTQAGEITIPRLESAAGERSGEHARRLAREGAGPNHQLTADAFPLTRCGTSQAFDTRLPVRSAHSR